MSTPYFRPSMHLPDEDITPDTFTEARSVVQQHNSSDGSLGCMFTMEMNADRDRLALKAFSDSQMVATSLSYDTATAIYMALSAYLDEMESNLDNVYSKD